MRACARRGALKILQRTQDLQDRLCWLSPAVFASLAMPRLNAKDFLAGLLFVAFGLAFLVLAQRYPMGSARRMGPGYFPQVLALALIGIGSAAMLRSLARPPAAIGRVAGKALLMVSLSVLLFGLTVERWGLSIASP